MAAPWEPIGTSGHQALCWGWAKAGMGHELMSQPSLVGPMAGHGRTVGSWRLACCSDAWWPWRGCHGILGPQGSDNKLNRTVILKNISDGNSHHQIVDFTGSHCMLPAPMVACGLWEVGASHASWSLLQCYWWGYKILVSISFSLCPILTSCV